MRLLTAPACLLLITCLSGCVASRYSIGNAAFVLHSGSSFNNTASKVETWGIWMRDGSSVLYRQLASITTTSERLASEIAEAIPQAKIDTTSTGYFFDLAELEFEPRPAPPQRVGLLADERMHLGGHLGPFSGIEAHAGLIPARTTMIQFTLGMSVAWNVLGTGDSPGTAGFFGGFAAGIEYEQPKEFGGVGVAARVWKRFVRHAELRSSGPQPTVGIDAVSLGFFSTYRLSPQFSASVELRGYLWDERYDGYKNRVGVVVMLRRSFRKAYPH